MSKVATSIATYRSTVANLLDLLEKAHKKALSVDASAPLSIVDFVDIEARKVSAAAMSRSGDLSLVKFGAVVRRSSSGDFDELVEFVRGNVQRHWKKPIIVPVLAYMYREMTNTVAPTENPGETVSVEADRTVLTPEQERERQRKYAAKYRARSKRSKRPDGRVLQAAYFEEVEKMLAHLIARGEGGKNPSMAFGLLCTIVSNATASVVAQGYSDDQVRDKRASMVKLREDEILQFMSVPVARSQTA